MDWDAFWRGYETGYYAAVREYEERTFADYIDGGYDMYATDEEDEYDEWRADGRVEDAAGRVHA